MIFQGNGALSGRKRVNYDLEEKWWRPTLRKQKKYHKKAFDRIASLWVKI
jgi:hypothetical protein